MIAHLEALGHTVIYHQPTRVEGQAQIDLSAPSAMELTGSFPRSM